MNDLKKILNNNGNVMWPTGLTHISELEQNEWEKCKKNMSQSQRVMAEFLRIESDTETNRNEIFDVSGIQIKEEDFREQKGATSLNQVRRNDNYKKRQNNTFDVIATFWERKSQDNPCNVSESKTGWLF